jgi:formate dehydrogenase subunit beta
MEKQLQEIAKKLIAQQEIDLLIGYERGSVPLTSRPFFIKVKGANAPENLANKLVWNSFCSNNLAVFLPKYFETNPFARKRPPKPKIGIVAKGCDLRSIVVLIKEKQAPRENLVLIGVPCQGMIDKRKVEAAIAAKTSCVQDAEIHEYHEQDGMLYITTKNGDIHMFNKEAFLQDACQDCRYPMPEGTDYLIEGATKEPGDGGYKKIQEFEMKTPQERWQYFLQEMSKCIRCTACRQACPTCWCKECFADQMDLKWIGVSTNISDTMIFHLIRIFHQSGRCVECDACYRACPMGVDLRTFTKKIGKDVEELFAFFPDFNLETIPPISTFREDDSESFITEP